LLIKFRISPYHEQINLTESTSSTLPFENAKNVRTICVSPDGRLLLSIDEDGRALVINRRRRALLHHFTFKGTVRAASFSPDGNYIAAAVGRLVQVWRRPGLEKTVAPMELHRTYGQCHADIVALDWSEDGCWIAAASKDLTTRIFSMHPREEDNPLTLAGKKDTPIAVHFTSMRLQESAGLLSKEPPALYTLSRDGALHAWTYYKAEQEEESEESEYKLGEQEEEIDIKKNLSTQQSLTFSGGNWKLTDKYYFNQRGAKLTAAAFHGNLGILAVGFSNGLFELLQLPDNTTIHTLSVGREKITSLTFNRSGDWVALGSAALGQLLVWEWRSESYVLKQQGHYYDVSAVNFSPDGAYLVTGADDAKVKVWTLMNGFCFVTFADHTAPVTAVAFAPSGHAVLSASLDGTIRAYDLVRYRNFRTMTTPTPVQFSSLSIDPGGEIVVAGSSDSFQIFVWSLKTGRLLDVLAAHEGPVIALSFAPGASLLASGSWDKTVRTWDVFSGKGGVEELRHSHDVLALAWRPDGRQLASSTLDGQIYLWDPIEAELQATIHGRRDIAGGRLRSDRRTAENTSSGRAFTSLAYSADGAYLLAGGSSKYVCMYDVNERVMLRRFQITYNKSLDGVLDQLNSKNMTDAGPLDQINDDASDLEEEANILSAPGGGNGGNKSNNALPGTAGSNAGRIAAPKARTRGVALSPTGRSWAAATTEGVLLYSLDEGMVFDPTDLAEDVTPAAVLRALGSGAYLRALLVALRLRDPELTRHVLFATPPTSVELVVATLPAVVAPGLLGTLAEALPATPHVEHVLSWVKALCSRHGMAMQSRAGEAAPALRALHKALAGLQEDLGSTVEANLYSLQYLCTVAGAATAPESRGADGAKEEVVVVVEEEQEEEKEEEDEEELLEIQKPKIAKTTKKGSQKQAKGGKKRKQTK
jgi:periodic tryptophan protein 2